MLVMLEVGIPYASSGTSTLHKPLCKGLDEDVDTSPRLCLQQEEGNVGIRGLARAVLVGTVAVALGSPGAGAQTVTYVTGGAFSGTGCTAVQCVFGGFTLSYANSATVTAAPPVNNVDMGL